MHLNLQFHLKILHIIQILSLIISSSAPRAATHWKLQQQPNGETLVLPAEEDFAKVASEDPVLSILLAEKYGFGPDGVKTENAEKEGECVKCENDEDLIVLEDDDDPLHCKGRADDCVYDVLVGVLHRMYHPYMPEPEVSLIFKRSEAEEIDLNILEYNLREALQLEPNSLAVLNQVGNFWRVKGATSLAVECFRRALVIDPEHPDVLLNLARVLFNLEYNSDALLLAVESLRQKGPGQNAWLQHFTLGEIHQAMSHHEDATHHFRQVLDLNPNFQPAERHLHRLADSGSYNANLYTLGIIIALFCLVFVVLYLVTEVMAKRSKGKGPRVPGGPGSDSRIRGLKGKRGSSC